MTFLLWPLPALAGSRIEGVAAEIAPIMAAAIDQCVAERPWWGDLSLRIFPATEPDPASFSVGASDEKLFEADSEHYYAAPTECIETALAALPAQFPAIHEWIAAGDYIEFSASVPRDEAARDRITLTGANDEILTRLRDRAQRCGAANHPGSSWIDVEVMVGKNGFDKPTGVVKGTYDGGLSECMSKNYLMDLNPSTKPSMFTVILNIAGKDGKVPGPAVSPVKFASARAHTRGGTTITVELNTTELGCDTLGKARYDVPEGEKRAELAVQEVFRPDGTKQWRVVYGWYANSTSTGDQGPATVTGDATKGVSITLPPGFTVGRDPGLVLNPTLTAIGCGDHPQKMVRGDAPDGTPEAADRDLSGLKLTIAGNTVPLRGAILMGTGDDQRLDFSTGGMSCYALWSEADINYSVDLPKSNSGSAFFSGTKMPSQNTDSYEAKDKPIITLGKPVNGEMPLDIQLAYDHNGYPISLRGKATVLDCRR